jgi:hypothetical protein
MFALGCEMKRIPHLKKLAMLVMLASSFSAYAQQPDVSPNLAAPNDIERERPISKPLKYALPPIDPKQVPPPSPLEPRTSVSVPDRWRIMDTLGFKFPLYDPYNHNVLKGDKPFEPFAKWGSDWFLALSAISDSLIEVRRLPTPVGAQSSERPGAVDLFGRANQTVFVQTIILSASVIKGNTTFKPPDYEFRFVPAIQVNQARLDEVRGVRVDPREGKARTDNHVGIQELFADVHLRNVSDNYDFDSIRVGIQPFQLVFGYSAFETTINYSSTLPTFGGWRKTPTAA